MPKEFTVADIKEKLSETDQQALVDIARKSGSATPRVAVEAALTDFSGFMNDRGMFEHVIGDPDKFLDSGAAAEFIKAYVKEHTEEAKAQAAENIKKQNGR
jgi:hypothetical protein